MQQEFGLASELGKLRYYRTQLETIDPLYKESEMCYQMISLYMELDKLLTDKHWDKDYLQEKAETVFRNFRCTLEGKISL